MTHAALHNCHGEHWPSLLHLVNVGRAGDRLCGWTLNQFAALAHGVQRFLFAEVGKRSSFLHCCANRSLRQPLHDTLSMFR